MKFAIARTKLVILFAAALIVSLSAPAYARDGDECSLARAAGKWSFTDQGTVLGIGPRTAAGVLTLDGNGNVLNGVAASSLNGTIASETLSGTYTVNPDCSGTFDAKIFSGGAELFEVTLFTAYDSDMREIRAVFTSVVAPNGTVLPTVIHLEGRKQ